MERIGVYICHCGLNIAGVIDPKKVVEHVKSLPFVVIAKDHRYMCSESGQEMIKKDIKENNLTRVVVASCSPRMHESTFKKVLEEANLNPYLFEMVNIREQCSWVHIGNPEKGTEKAKDLVRMAVMRAQLLEPLEVKEVDALDSVLVIGGGVAGIQAALDLAEQDFEVFLVEKEPSIGGHMAQLDKTFPTMDCSICILAPKMVDAAKHPNITLLTYSEVQEVSGSVGNFHVEVLRKTRFVDEKKCVGCGICATKCPIKLPSEFDVGLGTRKAIYVPFPQSVPLIYSIDKENCLYFTKGVCKLCERFCEANAIDFNQKEKVTELDVGAIIVAIGYDPYEASSIREYGHGFYKDVITSLELERMLSASGPTEGKILRPSDGKKPKLIGFIQCVGSRDERTGNIYCSNTCCMNAIKQARQIKEKHPESEIYIFYIDIRAFGRGYEDFYRKARGLWINFVRGNPSEIIENPETKNLIIRTEDMDLGKIIEIEVDLVVLSIGMVPRTGLENLSKILHVPRGADGFLLEAHPKLRPVDTHTAGIFLAGACQGPKDIPESVAQGKAAASSAASLLSKGKIKIEPITAYVDEFLCRGCGRCEEVCDFSAVKVEEVKPGALCAVVNEALCKGCGVCSVECPTGAISMRHFTDKQILAMIRTYRK